MLDGDAAHAFDLGLGVEGLDLTWLDSCYSPFADLDSASERYAGDLGIDHEQGITAETGDSDMAQEGTIPTDAMPEGMCLVQLDPWAAHRGSILEQLRTTGKLTADQISWLSCANMKLFLGSFFRYLHRHTPFIHCPTWNISTARTHLILSMMLVGAMYAGDLKVNGPKAGPSDDKLQLDTLQSLYLLAMVDAFYIPSKRYTSTFDFARLVSWARRSGYFDGSNELSDQQDLSWEAWIKQECFRRTVYMIYLFDAARTIFFFEKPQMSAYEMRCPLPTHEAVYSAPTRALWDERYGRAKNLSQLQYPVIIYHFLCGTQAPSQSNLSVMGCFIVLHGILVYIWQDGQLDPKPSLRPRSAIDQRILDENSSHRRKILRLALDLWHACWQRSINDPSSNHASGLYRDNSIIYWYLGCLLAQHGSPFMQYDSASSGRYRFIGVPRLMKDLNLFMKKGHLDRANTSDEVIAALSDPQWIAHLEGLRRGQGPKPGGAGVTTSSRQNAGDIQLHPAPGEPNLPAAEEENMDRLALDFMLSRSL
ncbi:hypothetical protein LTR72_009468 [Exophiala xenobiotica]|nr:hypothetical protein LTR72_009468 [Exophiala xenobiotica]KAK5291917.1 hypothetical protein LTR14_005466 [Exophiala xenobiotica]